MKRFSQMDRLNITRTTILSKLMYKSNGIPIRSPTVLLLKIDKPIPKFRWGSKTPRRILKEISLRRKDLHIKSQETRSRAALVEGIQSHRRPQSEHRTALKGRGVRVGVGDEVQRQSCTSVQSGRVTSHGDFSSEKHQILFLTPFSVMSSTWLKTQQDFFQKSLKLLERILGYCHYHLRIRNNLLDSKRTCLEIGDCNYNR